MGDHHAMFPRELPRRLVRMYTKRGERVLDPFAGSGTTLAVAQSLGREGWGYELNADFQSVMERRIGPGLTQYSLREDGQRSRKADDGPAFYGSAIALDQVGRPRHGDEVKVTAVLGPIQVELADGRRIHLEGLGQPLATEPCRSRLQELTLHKFVRVEETGPGRGYVRLRNRTMINSRLLREGLAPVDPEADHRNRTRFLRYANEV